MGKKIGLLGGLLIKMNPPSEKVKIKSGKIKASFDVNRIFSYGSIRIGNLYLDKVKILWDTGAEITSAYIENKDFIGTPKIGSFMITSMDAGIKADIYPATIDLGGGIIADLCIGVADADATEEDSSADCTDIILGMNVIRKGVFLIDGEKQEWSFEVK